MTQNEVRDLLLAAADPSFKEFNDKITNCNTAPSIGVRVPEIRKIAAQVVNEDWEAYLLEMEGTEPRIYQEEHMLWGMVLGKAKMSPERRVYHLERWIPGILSWADCDCSISTFKFVKKEQEFWYEYCCRWLKSQREFEVRFALVTLMQYFINDTYIETVLEIFAGKKVDFGASFSADAGHALHVTPESKDSVVGTSGKSTQASFSADVPYYIRMAQAWALSVCFVKYRELTWNVLAERTIDPWVQNKAIQKCRESYRVSAEDKELLKTLKMR